MNQLFSPHIDKSFYNGMFPYGLGKMGEPIASTEEHETACWRMTAGVPSW